MDKIREYIYENSSMRAVIEGYGIQIDRTGKFLCPFHNDKHPSAGILKNDKSFNCFSCGEKGNIYNFIDKYEQKVNGRKLSSNDIYRKMAELSGLNVDLNELDKQEQKQKKVQRSSYNDRQQELLETLGFANRAYVYFMNTQSGKPAKDYLEQRGITQDIIQEFSIGYSPEGYLDKLIHEADQHTIEEMEELIKKNPLYKYQNLFDVGLLKSTEDLKTREVFRNRITIPIADNRGNIVGFGARTLDKNNKVKYLNTAETELFHKSNILFNYYKAKHEIKDLNEVILVEGYMDVIGARQLNYRNVVGLMGTAFSDENLKTILDLNCNVTLALDNDEAGERAIISAIHKIREQDPEKIINVIDISKIGNNYKDFGDLGQAKVQKDAIENAKISSFEFLLDRLYFKNKQMENENTILEVYQTMQNENLITNSKNKTLFLNYVAGHSKWSKEEIESIINLKELITPYEKYVEKRMIKDTHENIQAFLKTFDDKVLTNYYELHKEEMFQQIYQNLKNSTERYYDKDFTKLNVAMCFNDILKDDEKWTEYQKINRFQYEQSFLKCYSVQDVNNETVLQQFSLQDEQKRKIVEQYEKTVDENIKLYLGHVDEVYIINSIKDLDMILPNEELLSNDIKEVYIKQLREHHKMQFFKYATIFPREFLNSIDSKYKTEDGKNYKTIMLVDNLNHDIKLTQDNIIQEENLNNAINIELEEQIHNGEVELVPPKNSANSNLYYFTVNMDLLLKEEKDNEYIVRIPNTKGQYYMHLDKENCRWMNEDKKILLSCINKNKTYDVLERTQERDGELIPTKLEGLQIMRYWEDKTKQVNPQKSTKKDVIVIPSYKIHSTTHQGCYIASSQENMFYFIPNRVMTWQDESHTNLEIKPSLTSRFSLYQYIDGNMKIQNRQIRYKDLEKDFSIKTSQPSRREISIKLSKENIKKQDDFVLISLYDKETQTNGYVKVNQKFICTDENNQLLLKAFKNYTYKFHTKDGLKTIDVQQLQDMYRNELENKKEMEFEKEGV